MENFRPTDRSTCLRPKPVMSFRASVPCRMTEASANAAGFKLLPPGAVGFEIQTGCPATRSGRLLAEPPGSGEREVNVALIGNTVRATTIASRDQSFVRIDSRPGFATAGR